jgi:hypothetical protein
MEQGKNMNCIEVFCPNVCRPIAIFWEENVHTIAGNLQSMSFKWLISVSIFDILS